MFENVVIQMMFNFAPQKIAAAPPIQRGTKKD